MSRFRRCGVILLAVLGALLWTEARCRAARPPVMEKYVSTQGNFVLYKPQGWMVKEDGQADAWSIMVSAPHGDSVVLKAVGKNRAGKNILGLVKDVSQPFQAQARDFHYDNIWLAPDSLRVVYDYLYTHPGRGQKKGRCWIALEGDRYQITRCEAPAGQFADQKPLLLAILANIRLMRGAFLPVSNRQTAVILPLRPCRLGDGSASFSLPRDWTYKDLKKTQFFATDPQATASFIVTNITVLTPQLGASVPNFPVSPYLHPAQALAYLMATAGLATDFQFLQNLPRNDLNRQIAQGHTAGPANAADLVYTFRSKGRRGKGYTFGISFGSRLGTHWNFWHMTVTAPQEQFEEYVPTFVAMLQSYKIDDQFAQQYIVQGMQRLRQLQRQTAEMAARNAREIPAMMQAAYDERQRSMDYIDYQRTKYIRGEQDWISNMEGGAIYHTDSWGTKNTYTGETWSGAPYDYLHFTGDNPKYRESMTAVDSRRLYDAVFGKGK